MTRLPRALFPVLALLLWATAVPAAPYANPQFLIETDELARTAGAPAVRIVDLRGDPDQGAAAYRAANTLDAMVGHRSPRYERFGFAAARLDDALTWPAARIGALLSVALAPAVGGGAREAWRVLRRDGARHPSPNAGRMEAAFAGALGVCLGGRNVYAGSAEERPRLGDGSPPGAADVRRAAALSLLVGAAGALLAAGVVAWRERRAA